MDRTYNQLEPIQVPRVEVRVIHHHGVKGHLALVHEGEEHVGEHNECLLELGIRLCQSRRWARAGAIGGHCLGICQLGIPAGVEQGEGDGEGEVRKLGEIPFSL